MREQRLGRLAVVLDRADAAAVRDADDDRELDLAERPGVHLGELGDDLVVRREDEPVELDLHDRPVAAQREADGRADDAGLGERGVDHPVLAEVLLQPVGDPEDAAELADVLAHDQDLGVGLQGLAQRFVDRLGEGEFLCGHGHLPSPRPRRTPGTRRTGPAPRRRARARPRTRVEDRHRVRVGHGRAPPRAPACPTPRSPPRAPRRTPRRRGPRRSRYARSRRIGSFASHASRSSSARYFVGSSEVVCAPMR